MAQGVSDRLHASLRQLYGGRPWLMCVDVLPSYRRMHAELARYDIERSFVLAARDGTGEPPDDDAVDWHCLSIAPASDLMGAIHGAERALRDLPEAVQARIDAFDPARRMQAIGVFFGNGRPVAGRPMIGARPAAWQALEDKVVIDAVWDAAGVPRADCEVVPVAAEALRAAAERLDQGAGTVWAGDAREGFHGGASRTRWVRDPASARAAAQLLAAHCDTARVMPFLDGIPCAIHGIVMPDGVVVLRPAEMLVLRRGVELVYCRAATLWDPPAAAREEMRAVARRVGDHLRRSVDYRGAFTIDGVLTAAGFRPTELNPRVGAAMGMMVPDVSMSLVHYALIEGHDVGVSAAALESEWLAAADGTRSASAGFTLPTPAAETRRYELVYDGGAWRPAAEGEPVDGKVMYGPGVTGSFLNLKVDTERMPTGPSFAPVVAAFARWADAQLGVELGALQPAPDLS